MSDGFQPAEAKYRVTEAVLRVLSRYSYPTVISTRGPLIGEALYLDLLKSIGSVVVQFSFSTTRKEVAARVEPFSTAPDAILRTMERLATSGIVVTCRWQPYIPGTSEPPHEFMSRVASAGARHVALEHLKLPFERSNPLWPLLIRGVGDDLHAEYRRSGAKADGREYVLPPEAKRAAILEAAKSARINGMTFGAADNEFQYLSDGACCCSGVDQFPGFENWFKHQIGYALRKCRGKEIIYESIATEWIPTGSVDRYLNSNSRLGPRLGRPASMRDHIWAKWNATDSAGSPMSFYGVSCCNATTRGKRAYKWA